jgi:hypothetical protein
MTWDEECGVCDNAATCELQDGCCELCWTTIYRCDEHCTHKGMECSRE